MQSAVTSTVKGMLLGSLSDMGCKGAAMANALQALDSRSLKGALPMIGLAGGLPGMPGGIQAMTGAGMDPAALAALAGGRMPALPAGTVGIDPQMAAQLQAMLSQPPLSTRETLAMIDEMQALGLLPAEVKRELLECMVLLPQSTPAMGMAFGMLKPMLPQLREARDQLHALSPAEQDELAESMAAELKARPADERQAFLGQLDGGFFPPRLAESLRQRLR